MDFSATKHKRVDRRWSTDPGKRRDTCLQQVHPLRLPPTPSELTRRRSQQQRPPAYAADNSRRGSICLLHGTHRRTDDESGRGPARVDLVTQLSIPPSEGSARAKEHRQRRPVRRRLGFPQSPWERERMKREVVVGRK